MLFKIITLCDNPQYNVNVYLKSRKSVVHENKTNKQKNKASNS